MKKEERKIQTFTDLLAWQETHGLVLLIYKETQSFPKEEIFGLTGQMRRAAISVTSNIAEGFGRRTTKEKNQFYSVAQGSLTELQSQLLVAKDVKYLREKLFFLLEEKVIFVHKLLGGLIKCSFSSNPYFLLLIS